MKSKTSKIIYRIALINRKGGCGKTTSLFELAGIWSCEQHSKILVIDLDAQRNTTRTMSMHTPEELKPTKTIMDVLNGADITEAICPVYWQERGSRVETAANVFVLMGDQSIDSAEGIVSLDENVLEAAGERIRTYVEEEKYDFVLVDMPPSFKAINDFCFKYLADYSLIPFSPDEYSADGYSQIMSDMDDAREINPDVKVVGLFLAKMSKNFGLHNHFERQMKELDQYICSVPYTSSVAESTYFGRPINLYKPISEGCMSYRKIAKTVVKRIKQDY